MELIGVRRDPVTYGIKTPFLWPNRTLRREELWAESKLRLKAVVHEAIDTLTNGLRSFDEKIAIISAVIMRKTVSIYGELN